MNCAEANQINLGDYLNSIGYLPQKMNGNYYRYLSQLRSEKHAAFRVEKSKNVWDDQGICKGGNMIDFVKEMHQCAVSEAVQNFFLFTGKILQKKSEKTPVSLA